MEKKILLFSSQNQFKCDSRRQVITGISMVQAKFMNRSISGEIQRDLGYRLCVDCILTLKMEKYRGDCSETSGMGVYSWKQSGFSVGQRIEDMSPICSLGQSCVMYLQHE